MCCDGTWNTPDKMSGADHAATNVTKIALGLGPTNGIGKPQELYYQRGVGTRRFERFRGGIFGYGLSRNIRDCYRFIVDHYEVGDRLYFFGFSRGAYTARSSVGFIRNCGILRPEHSDRVDEAYALYRSGKKEHEPSAIESQIFRRMYSHPEEPKIHFVGVWDTVGSVGIPIGPMPLVSSLWGFHNTELSSHVTSAFQALAIDERRGPFKPTLWHQQNDVDGQTLEQVWFAGVHCDVGGGYATPALSEIPLLWMVDRAIKQGMVFKPNHFVVTSSASKGEPRWLGQQVAPDALGKIHNSMKPPYTFLWRHRRKLTDRDHQSAASTAVRRLDGLEVYRPRSLARWVKDGRSQTEV